MGVLALYTRSTAEAVRWLSQAAADFERLDDPAGLIRTLNHLAFVFMQQGRYREARCTRAASCHRQQGRRQGTDQRRLHNLGLVR